MEIIYVSILGIIQGLTELWPISSSAHLLIAPFLAGLEDLGLTVSVFLHSGTLFALLIYFRKDIKELLSRKKRKLLVLILISTIPAALAGLLLEDLAETVFRSPLIVSINLIIFGLVLFWADRVEKDRNIRDLKLSDGILIGLAQVLALVPGVSRSGITISAGMFLGQKRAQSARFSFLLLIPVLFGATILKATSFFSAGLDSQAVGFLSIIIGGLVSFAFSYLALVYLFRWLKSAGYWPFVVYRIILGLVVLAIYIS